MPSNAFDLDDLAREVAKVELGESPAVKMSHIEVMRKWIMTHNYLECRTDDEFILRFLRVSKFSCEAAKERIEKYCIARSSKLDGAPEWFEDHDVSNAEYRAILETGLMYPLQEPDAKGRIVVVTNYGVCAKFDQMKCGRVVMMMFEYICAKYPRAQICGIRFLENASGYTASQMAYWNLERVPKVLSIMQGSMPARIKSIDWYNIPTFARIIMEAGMAIMRSKVRERLMIHSKYSDKPVDIPSRIIPPVLGGEGPSWEEVKDGILKDLYMHQGELNMTKMCKVLEHKRPKKVVNGDSWGISGTYISKSAD